MDKRSTGAGKDANKTPLGKPPPNFPKPPASSSLLKPSYLSKEESDNSSSKASSVYEQYQLAMNSAASYGAPKPPKFSHYEYEAYSQPEPSTPSDPRLNSLAYASQFGITSNFGAPNKIVPANFSNWGTGKDAESELSLVEYS